MTNKSTSSIPKANEVSTNQDDLISKTQDNDKNDKAHNECTGTETTDADPTVVVGEVLSSNLQDIKDKGKEQQDTEDRSPNKSSFMDTCKIGCRAICCLVIIALVFYSLGKLTGIFEMKNDHPQASSYGGYTRQLRARRSWPSITLGAYYYPWHGGDFHGRKYLREYVGQEPVLGEYDDRDYNVIALHLEWSQRARINLWVTSWWGPFSREDKTLREHILTHPDLLEGDHKISLFYETMGRIQEKEGYSLHRVRPDMEFMCTNYFSHSNYFRIDGKPVVYVYLTRVLQEVGKLPEFVRLMREAARGACGTDVYIIGDQIFGPPHRGAVENAKVALSLLDGVTNYDVYGSIAQSVGRAGGHLRDYEVRRYYGFEQNMWKTIANQQHCAYIPAISPGYNDLGVRPEANHNPLSRSLHDEDPGSLFEVAAESARDLVDPTASNVLMVNSFNEWHEDTQIEPVEGRSNSSPYDLTRGLRYYGYESLYLDILRSEFRD